MTTLTPTHAVTNLGKTYRVIILSTRLQVDEEYALCQDVDRDESLDDCWMNVHMSDLVEIDQ
jgi:hypothetical protein